MQGKTTWVQFVVGVVDEWLERFGADTAMLKCAGAGLRVHGDVTPVSVYFEDMKAASIENCECEDNGTL